MTRTTRYKAVYFGILASGVTAGLGAFTYFRPPLVIVVAAVLIALIPGRVLGFFWRDLLRGLRLLNSREYAASKICSERFLERIRNNPWIKHLIWLGTSSYSRDPEVLALNNLGAAELMLGEVDAARRHLMRASALDPLCPLPYFNLGVLEKAEGHLDEAQRLLAQAVKLGYTRGVSDKIVSAAQSRLAITDGAGHPKA